MYGPEWTPAQKFRDTLAFLGYSCLAIACFAIGVYAIYLFVHPDASTGLLKRLDALFPVPDLRETIVLCSAILGWLIFDVRDAARGIEKQLREMRSELRDLSAAIGRISN
jgi:hypothetical protein